MNILGTNMECKQQYLLPFSINRDTIGEPNPSGVTPSHIYLRLEINLIVKSTLSLGKETARFLAGWDGEVEKGYPQEKWHQ